MGGARDWGTQDLFQRPRPESRACGVSDDGMTWNAIMTEVVMKVVRNNGAHSCLPQWLNCNIHVSVYQAQPTLAVPITPSQLHFLRVNPDTATYH